MSMSPLVDDRSTSLPAQMWRLARRNVVTIVALVLLAGALVGGINRLQPSTYRSTVSFVVQTTSGANDTETLIRTMQALVESDIIGADLVEATGVPRSPEEVVDSLSVSRPPGAGVFTVEVEDTDRGRSQRLAAALVPVFQDRVEELSAPEPGQLAVNYSIRPWGAGTVNTTVVPPPVTRNTVLGISLAVLVGVLLLAIRARRHPALLTPAQAGEAYGLPVLGALPRSNETGLAPADALAALLPAAASLGWPPRPSSVLVLGSDDQVDRAALVLALAQALARHEPVVVVDASTARDRVTGHLRLKRRKGLHDVVLGAVDVRSALLPLTPGQHVASVRTGSADRDALSSDDRVRVLPAGLGGDGGDQYGAEVATVVRDLQLDHVVLVDGSRARRRQPPAALLNAVEGVLVIATLGRTSVAEAEATGDALRVLTDRPVLVIVVGHDRLVTGGVLSRARRSAEADEPSSAQRTPLPVAPGAGPVRRPVGVAATTAASGADPAGPGETAPAREQQLAASERSTVRQAGSGPEAPAPVSSNSNVESEWPAVGWRS